MAGSPLTFSTTRHWPSPVIGFPASDVSAAGMSGTNSWRLCTAFAGPA